MNRLANASLMTVIILAIIVLGSLTPSTNDSASVREKINSSLASGKTDVILTLLSDPVDLTVPGSDDSYSKKQAGLILNKFFASNPVKSYTEKHSGNSVDGSVFTIGSYKSTNNKSFRSYFLIKKINNNYLIQLVEFEAE